MKKITIEELKKKQDLLSKVDLRINDKLTHAVKRNLERMDSSIKPRMAEAKQDLHDKTIDLASVDERGNLIENGEGVYSFTPENKKKLNKIVTQVNEVFDAKEVAFEGYKITDIDAPGFERAKVLFDDFDKEELEGILY